MIDSDLQVREFPEHPRLGRKLAVLDPSSLRYAAVGTLVGTDAAPRNKIWRTYSPPRSYDQGFTSQCTCYSGKRIINTQPLRIKIDPDVRIPLEPEVPYKIAQTIDPWPGEDYDGTSVLAAAKAFKQLGLISGYRWCFGIDDVLRTLSWYGTVGIGVSWYDSMFTYDSKFNIIVDTESGLAGGHAVTLQGNDLDNERVVVNNSWGLSWGDRGRAYLSYEDLDLLLSDWGEAVVYLCD